MTSTQALRAGDTKTKPWIVQFEWRQESFALRADVHWNGGLTGIFGPSGAGKSTFLEILLGLKRPDRGLIQAQGQILWSTMTGIDISPEERNFGWVPQDFLLFPNLSVAENLKFDAPHQAFASDVLSTLELDAAWTKWPTQLSGGERQRVALGRALHGKSRALLLDEPLNALDRPLKRRILSHLKKESAHRDMILISHDREDLLEWCDQIFCLDGEQVRIAAAKDLT